jgi:hypothetical protein
MHSVSGSILQYASMKPEASCLRKTLGIGAFFVAIPFIIVEGPLSAVAATFAKQLPISSERYQSITRWNEECELVVGDICFGSLAILATISPRLGTWVSSQVHYRP